MTLEPFGENREFASSTEFDEAWAEYQKDTMSLYQKRHTCLAGTFNASHPDEQIPLHLIHQKITLRCKHGVLKPPRGEGKRRQKKSHFLDCPAGITAEAEQDENGVWRLVTKHEFTYHNHKCTAAMIKSYGISALLTHPEIAREVSGMLQAKADPQHICDTIAANYAIEITAKQISNFARDRLGLKDAVTNLRLMLQRFHALGSECMVVDDEHGDLAAVVMMSEAQQEFFRLYGDTLILDWTHNTNNMGFYLGSLMVTSASGHGVSVCDFLCVEQTEAMMSLVFEYFIEVNENAVDKVKSFIIDKDYKEWRVLERLFVKSAVLLCQFHVSKWFAYVVTMKKYGLQKHVRERVESILSNMIYSAWHGDDRDVFSESISAAQIRSTCSKTFDWFGIQRRARVCRDRIMSAASEAASGAHGTGARGATALATEEKEETHDARPAADQCPTVNLRDVMRLYKAAWVTTTTNGVSTKEYRRPKSLPVPQKTKATKSRTATKKVTAGALGGTVEVHVHPAARQLRFINKRWPARVVRLRAMYNPHKVRFEYETPFGGVCGCPTPCRKETCRNGLLRIFCSAACCAFHGKCGNGLNEHEDLQLVRKRGTTEYAVIATKPIDAGVVLGEYLGVVFKMKKSGNANEPQNGYIYKVKRVSQSHPDHDIYIDAESMGGITRFMNHSCAATAIFEEVRNGGDHTVVVSTTRRVDAGEEVTVDYGSELWFICRCGESCCQHRHHQYSRIVT